MKRRMMLTALVLIFAMILVGCGCEHEWREANCTDPQTCGLCGETEGAPKGHSWLAASCDAPKTCENCGLTEGERLGHDFGEDTPGGQNCEHPRVCIRCAQTEREAKPHTWTEATTEAPKICTVCGVVEGERIITDARFTTKKCKDLFGKWVGVVELPMEMVEPQLVSYAQTFACLYYFDFHNDGTVAMSMGIPEDGVFMQAMQAYTVDLMYAEFAAEGMDRPAADDAFWQVYGMTIQDYVAAELAKTDMNDLFSAFAVNYVYYVDENQLYLGLSWDGEMEGETYTLKDGKLYLPVTDGEDVEFSPVEE